jgi:hypothetical protein
MPNCFQLLRNGKPTPLVQIDKEMCEHFNVEPNPQFYYRGWYDIVGFGLACGYSFDKVREIHPDYKDICDWLEKHFEPKSWWESKL